MNDASFGAVRRGPPESIRPRASAAASPSTTASSSRPAASATSSRSTPPAASTCGAINLGVPIVNAPVANGGRVFVSTQDNHLYALAQTDGRKLWDHQGIDGIRRHPGKHQRRGRRRICHRALYVGRTLCAARAERPPGLERHADPFRRRDRALRTRRYRRTSGGRPRHGLCHQPFRHHGGDQPEYRRPAVVARHRRHPDALGRRRLRLCADDRPAAHLPDAQGRQGEVDAPVAALGRSRQARSDPIVWAGRCWCPTG